MRHQRLFVASFSLAAIAVAAGARTSEQGASGANGFVGAQACASCHQTMHDTWSRGRHSKMIQPATAATVVGDFSRRTVTLHGRPFQLRAESGQFFVTESYLTGKPQEHRVELTLGSRRVQHYLTTIENGWIIVLPPSWNVQGRDWFDNMDIVGPDARDRTPVQQWNRDCVGCHVSGEEKNFGVAKRDYATRWTDFGTSCERCHGPGRSHVQQYTAARLVNPAADRLIVKPTRLDPATSSMICAQCHSLRNVINPGYAAGDDYYDFFNPRLEYDPGTDRELPYWPDGRPRRFSNDAIGLWQSACFRRGRATCTTCHGDPHEPNIERNPQLASSNNALCTQCHQTIGSSLVAHTRHAATSAGSSCVECHMPKTVISLNATMRDHTMSLPAPENSVAFNIPNACTNCHAEKNAAWAVDVLKTWWPDGRRSKLVERAQAFAGARKTSPDALARLLAIANDSSAGPLIQATAVGYLRRYPGAPARDALLEAATAEHPAIRTAAVAGLASVEAADESGRVRAALIAALSDPRRSVRIAALVSLVNGKGGPIGPAADARVRDVGREFATLSSLYEDDPGFDRDLGTIHLVAGDFNAAAKALETCLLLDPRQPSATFLLALARLGQGKTDDARALLARVEASDPSYAAAQTRLQQLRR